MRRVPLPLAVVLVVAGLQALAWSVLLPAFQGQDEAPHFAYAQRLIETGKPTWLTLEDVPPGSSYSKEVSVAINYAGFGSLAGNVAMRPYGTEVEEARWRRQNAGLRERDRADGARTSAMRNPPLYYLYEGAVYAPFEGADVLTRQYVLRWATIPFFLLAVLFTWLLAGEVFGRRRWLQTLAALVVALQPMLAQLGGIVNPDAAIAAVWAAGLWLAAVIVNRGVTRGRVAGAVALGLTSALVHPRAAPLVVVLAAALFVAVWPRLRGRRSTRLAGFGAVVAGGAAFAGALVVYALPRELSLARAREFVSYVWQFYLPRPGGLTPTIRDDWDVRDVFVDRLWSGFVGLEVNLSTAVLDAISIGTMIGAVLVIAAMVYRRHAVRRRAALLAVFALGPVVLLATLHAAAWRDLPVYGDPVITGRYLTPLLPLLGLAVATVAGVLPRRIGPAAGMVVVGLEALVALAALAAAVVRFHV